MNASQIVFALLGFGLMSWAMVVSKQYVLIWGAMACWALVLMTQYMFGSPVV